MGVPIADEKLVGPVHVLTFLGLEIDTDEMMVRIPQSKMNALVAELKKFSKENKITLKDLQSLVGSLIICSKAVRSARAFNRRFYDLTVKAKKPHHFIKLNSEVKEDMKVWLSFLESFNGKAYFPESEWSDNETLELYTDSAGSETMGGSGFFSKEWVFFQWPQNWVDLGILKDITFLEFVPIVLSMAI